MGTSIRESFLLSWRVLGHSDLMLGINCASWRLVKLITPKLRAEVGLGANMFQMATPTAPLLEEPPSSLGF